MTGISESARTWEIERGTSLRRSTQGEVISESPVHVGTMRSDSRRTLAFMGMADRSPPLLGTMNIELRTPNIERRMGEN
jgi:hypothetical protein